MSISMNKSQYDFIVFGATSFVGKIMSEYMVAQYGGDKELSWAAAGRSKSKLEALRTSLGPTAKDLPLIVADAADETALKSMVSQTGVIISAVGPFALYGEPLVKVCAETGTDYCDLTGEPLWVRQMIEKYQETAKKSGARMIPCAGFDSMPSDLGVYYLQQQSKSQFGEVCSQVKMGVKGMTLDISGGSMSTGINEAKEAGADPAIQRELKNPYSLCPPDHAFSVKQRLNDVASFDADFDSWIAPFIMSGINTRIVHRSNALSGNGYGIDFNYDESVLMKKGLKARLTAMGTASGLAAFKRLSAIKLTRTIMENYFVPKPGEGPSPEAQKKGYYDFRFIGKTPSGKTIKAKVTGDGDPGYSSAAKIVMQAGIFLAKELPKEDKPGGFWTPATVFGDVFIKRLIDHAGLTFETL
jgi:short subunit dehydrogenase-like uncharacterized protein